MLSAWFWRYVAVEGDTSELTLDAGDGARRIRRLEARRIRLADGS